ncbi:MAG: sigma-70 family RNA polymerase sigma factor, partial [Candidatus Aminicenantes bacterium]|nr:sigma-70 family RNA polymerase sigma factor [Candidatus Aminicenantes bacterium]
SGRFRGDSSIGTFIYSITSRKIIDYIRRKTRDLKHIPEPYNPDDPHDHLEKKERNEIIYSSLKKLKPRHADILYMYYYLDVPRAQIAQIYSLSPRWVSEIIKSARKSLKRIIEL